MLENYLVPHLGQGTWMLYCMISIVELKPLSLSNKRELNFTSQRG